MKQFQKGGQSNGDYSPPLSDHDSFSDPTHPPSAGPSLMFDLEDNNSASPVTPNSNQSKESPGSTVSVRAQNIMQQYQDYTSSKARETGPDVAHGMLDCPKVWERIVNHPRFDEVEIEALCAELNSKVRIVSPRRGGVNCSVLRGGRVWIVLSWIRCLNRPLIPLLRGREVYRYQQLGFGAKVV
jgi:Transcription factor PAP1